MVEIDPLRELGDEDVLMTAEAGGGGGGDRGSKDCGMIGDESQS